VNDIFLKIVIFIVFDFGFTLIFIVDYDFVSKLRLQMKKD